MGVLYFQHRGAPIGSPCSPPLCNLVASVHEYNWAKSMDIIWQDFRLAGVHYVRRYVDNRTAILTKHARTNNTKVANFFHLDFYEPPVQLEDVGDNKFLGFNVCLADNTCQYVLPEVFRSAASAGSHRLILSGLRSRLHIIAKGTWPRSSRRKSMEQLGTLYEKQGFAPHVISTIVKKVSRRYAIRDMLWRQAKKKPSYKANLLSAETSTCRLVYHP